MTPKSKKIFFGKFPNTHNFRKKIFFEKIKKRPRGNFFLFRISPHSSKSVERLVQSIRHKKSVTDGRTDGRTDIFAQHHPTSHAKPQTRFASENRDWSKIPTSKQAKFFFRNSYIFQSKKQGETNENLIFHLYK